MSQRQFAFIIWWDRRRQKQNQNFLQSSGNGVYYEKRRPKDIIITTHVCNYMSFSSRHSSPHSYPTLHDICLQELPLINQHRNNNGPHHATTCHSTLLLLHCLPLSQHHVTYQVDQASLYKQVCTYNLKSFLPLRQYCFLQISLLLFQHCRLRLAYAAPYWEVLCQLMVARCFGGRCSRGTVATDWFWCWELIDRLTWV